MSVRRFNVDRMRRHMWTPEQRAYMRELQATVRSMLADRGPRDRTRPTLTGSELLTKFDEARTGRDA